MPGPQETKKAVIVVRTYPSPAKKGVEVSCTAAITDKGEWLRLFPIPYRFLDYDKRFRKYQWVEVGVRKATDTRPESYNLSENAITIRSEPLPTTNAWQARKDIVFPLRASSLCFLQRQRDERGFPTLGFFRPRTIDEFQIKPARATWTQGELELLRQGTLFDKGPQAELEKVPFEFRYRFHCDDDQCPGHNLICTDWELGESWRRWKDEYGQEWEQKFRQRYETDMIQKYETHFYVGTVHKHPGSWIIVGLFYPPPVTAPLLFTL
jgi:hypothetical protein